MPETRKVEHFACSDEPTPQKIGEDAYEVSDEELYQEALEQEFNDAHQKFIDALKVWDSLQPKVKDAILYDLVKWVLWKDGWLERGVL